MQYDTCCLGFNCNICYHLCTLICIVLQFVYILYRILDVHGSVCIVMYVASMLINELFVLINVHNTLSILPLQQILRYCRLANLQYVP